MNISWTDEARIDFGERLTNLRDYSPAAADKLARDVATAIDRLLMFPFSGRVVPEWEATELREVVVGTFRIIYRQSSDQIQIVTIHPGVIPLH